MVVVAERGEDEAEGQVVAGGIGTQSMQDVSLSILLLYKFMKQYIISNVNLKISAKFYNKDFGKLLLIFIITDW